MSVPSNCSGNLAGVTGCDTSGKSQLLLFTFVLRMHSGSCFCVLSTLTHTSFWFADVFGYSSQCWRLGSKRMKKLGRVLD